MGERLSSYCVRGGLALGLLAASGLLSSAAAHGIGGKDAAFVAAASGVEFWPFLYLGAKHMVTGYDHLLFILGVIFFLYRPKHVAIYVTLFSLGHSITLLAGVLGQVNVNPYIVDAIIGLSVVYKAFDNLNGFKTLFGVQPDTRIAVFAFGLVHGFGLATKVQALAPPEGGLIPNMLAFNIGVEAGQLIALGFMLAVITLWRHAPHYKQLSIATNVAMMIAGFVLIGYQLGGYAYGVAA